MATGIQTMYEFHNIVESVRRKKEREKLVKMKNSKHETERFLGYTKQSIVGKGIILFN